jgi:hypothetical protein
VAPPGAIHEGLDPGDGSRVSLPPSPFPVAPQSAIEALPFGAGVGAVPDERPQRG